jgi:hypothetical protein
MGDPSCAVSICILSIPKIKGGVIIKSRWFGYNFNEFFK